MKLRSLLIPLTILGATAAAALHYRRGVAHVLGQVEPHAEFWRSLTPSADGPVLIVLGDSTAQGVGAANPEDGWVGLVARELREDYPDLQIHNISLSGAKIAHVVNDQLPLVRAADQAPWKVICAVGGNDVALLDRPFDRYNEAEFRDGMEKICSTIPRGSVIAEVPYFAIPPYEARVRRCNAIIHEAAARHGHEVAPVHAATRAPFHRKARRLAADVFHPNEQGYRDWADAILEALRRVTR